MANMYRSNLSGGGTAPTGDATAADVLTGKTFSNAQGVGIAGAMPNNGAVSGTATPSQPYTIPAGYHNGSGVVTAAASNVCKGTSQYISDSAYCIMSLANADPDTDPAHSSVTSSPTLTLGDITFAITYVSAGSWTVSISSAKTGKLYVNGTLVKTWTSGDMTAYTFTANTTTLNIDFRAVLD